MIFQYFCGMNHQKILIIQEKMIGDVLISSLICNNLKRKFPNANIHYLVAPNTLPVLQGNPNIDQLVIYGDLQKNNVLEFYDFIRSIRASKYDVVIDAYGKIGSNLIAYFSGAKKRIGYKEKNRLGVYNVKLPYAVQKKSFKGLAIERRLELLKPFMDETEMDYLPKIYFSNRELEIGKSMVESIADTTICMVSLFGSSPNKSYPSAYMVKVLDTIGKQENTTILLNILPNQQEEAEQIIEACLPATQIKINTAIRGKGLRDFIVLMNFCDILVGNDGGAVNISKALNKPTFTIFSPWVPKEIWSILDDGIQHVGVHLNDYQPELLRGKSEHKLKNESQKLYQEFRPELFTKQLTEFLEKHQEKNRSCYL